MGEKQRNLQISYWLPFKRNNARKTLQNNTGDKKKVKRQICTLYVIEAGEGN